MQKAKADNDVESLCSVALRKSERSWRLAEAPVCGDHVRTVSEAAFKVCIWHWT
jgi:hypothetical protein